MGVLKRNPIVRKVHDVRAKLGVGIMLEEFTARFGVIELFARYQVNVNAFALAEDASIFRGQFKLPEVDPDLATQIKAIEVPRRGQESSPENVGRRITRFWHGPNGVAELVMGVIHRLFGKNQFHGKTALPETMDPTGS